MALPKRVKVGGGYYKGYKIAVSSAPGDYAQIIENTGGAAINGVSLTPDMYGIGDKMKLTHYAGSSGAGDVMAILCESVFNVGKNATIMLDFPAAELVSKGESVKFIYTNSGSIAGNVYLVAEWVGLKKTA